MVNRDQHYFYGIAEIRDAEGKIVRLGRRKAEGIKEQGGMSVVGVEKRVGKVVYC